MRASAVDKIGVANLDRLNNNPLIAKGKVLAEGMFTGIRMKVGGSVDEAVARAKGFMQHESGKPYQYGGTGNPSWDCSGLCPASSTSCPGDLLLRGVCSIRNRTSSRWAGSLASTVA